MTRPPRTQDTMRIICVSGNTTPGWRWIEHALPKDRFALGVYDCVPASLLERMIRRPYLPRYRAALQAAIAARSEDAEVVVSHGPAMTLWTALSLQAVRARATHMAFAFNFTNLPTGATLRLMQRAFRSVDRFVVPSSLERDLYAEVFELPKERFDLLLWGIEKPEAAADAPAMLADTPQGYACAIGGEGRDYGTLFEAVRSLPHVPVVCIGRPHSFDGLAVPPNVRVYVNAPSGVAWNVLAHARFSIVPLRDAEVPCGHVTLVAAMHHAKALVVTDSRGVSDYVRHEHNALLVPAGDPTALATAMLRLWNDPVLCARLGAQGQAFAREHTTEGSTAHYFLGYLNELKLR